MTARPFAIGPVLPVDLGALALQAVGGGSDAVAALGSRLSEIVSSPVLAIVHYGSSSECDARMPSDIDMLVLVGGDVRGGIWGRSSDVELDFYVEPIAEALNSKPSAWSHVADGRALLDGEGRVSAWLEGLLAWRDEHGGTRDEGDLLRDRVWAERMVARIASVEDPALRLLLKATLLAAIPELDAQSKRTASTSLRKWMERTREADPVLADILERYATGRDGLTGEVDEDGLAFMLRHIWNQRAE